MNNLIALQDDVEAQCLCIKRLHEVGEIGLILYYIGISMKRIDAKVIDVANAIGSAISK